MAVSVALSRCQIHFILALSAGFACAPQARQRRCKEPAAAPHAEPRYEASRAVTVRQIRKRNRPGFLLTSRDIPPVAEAFAPAHRFSTHLQ
jgi:hypothetical protein